MFKITISVPFDHPAYEEVSSQARQALALAVQHGVEAESGDHGFITVAF